jgi:predicted CXXCH cytochrome family protein
MKQIFKSFIFVALLFFFTSLIVFSCKDKSNDNKASASNKHELQADYVGRNLCAECHKMQHDLFQHSDHDMAMDIATDSTVLGDFNNSTFNHFDIISRFYRDGEKFMVHTEGPGGEMIDYEISHTFGVRPLQQYLIEFSAGAYQCLPIAWDTRPADEGGQKWFHLYGDEQIKHDDILFWTRPVQNWNFMCAECHSTNLKKDYDIETKSYNTTWSEIDVSCESCHGPGSIHIDWAEKVEQGSGEDVYPNLGLVVRLKDTDNATWVFDPDSTTARRSVPRQSDELVQMCARCHSRRAVTTEDYYHGGSLLETHWPSLLDEGLYFADGQIQDEVYVYGSFLQSKMYKAGVVCKDCHEPHSGKVYVDGNALCYRCHLAPAYGTREHHFHDPAKEGASCTECHMHERTYMQNDPRRDHSIRIPRPDLSDKLGTPNACIQCHKEKSNQWAADYLEKWYGEDLLNTEHYGEVIWAGRKSYPEALPKLIALAEDTENAPMIRATAISLLGNYADQSIYHLLSKTIRDKDPLIRYATLTVTQYSSEANMLQLVLNSLNDTVRLVRLLSANTLTRFPQEEIPSNFKEQYDKNLEEYMNSLMINADQPGTHINFGNLYLNLGDMAKAEESYKEAIDLEPGQVTAYINLADLYRRANMDTEGERVLKSALEIYPELSAIHYSLGLLYVRQGDQAGAMVYLEKAASLSPEESHYSYVYGIGLNSIQKSAEAIKFLESALENHPYDREILYGLTTLNIEQGDLDKALKYINTLVENYPADPSYRQLLNQLEGLK